MAGRRGLDGVEVGVAIRQKRQFIATEPLSAAHFIDCKDSRAADDDEKDPLFMGGKTHPASEHPSTRSTAGSTGSEAHLITLFFDAEFGPHGSRASNYLMKGRKQLDSFS